MKPAIYMDANATTPVLPAVLDAMRPCWEDGFGNASAVHSFGRGARGTMETARVHLANLLHAKPAEITFTSGGTESDNLALFGLLSPGDHLVVSSIEHDAVLHAADALEKDGVQVSRVPCDRNGVVSPEAVQAAMTAHTKLVSVMLANNETGVLQPVRAIADAAHGGGAWMHTDAVQVCGKMAVDVRALGCDLLSVSAHKMHGPQGVGALWVRSGIAVRPMLHGGGHERRRRAGTENVAGIAGLGAASALTAAWIASCGVEQLKGLRDRFELDLTQRVAGVTINGAGVDRLPNTTCATFTGVTAERLVIALDLMGLAISGGSACQSGTTEPSHVLQAMGLDDLAARSSVRFSLSKLNCQDDIATAVDLIAATVERMRSL